MKLQCSYEIMFGDVQKLLIAHLIPLKTINIVSQIFQAPAGSGRFLGLTDAVAVVSHFYGKSPSVI